jgi:2-(1,2-epoxy-1,2-dihydrophenyl)acetyl-CoA isomerase
MDEHLHYDVSDGIATITIDRPEKRNALTYGMYDGLIELTAKADADPDVRVVILTAVPGQFCAGMDLNELRGVEPGDDRTEFREGKQWYLADCSKPVIAAIDGPAAGLGVELATLSDIRIASTRARFSWVFVRRGLVPDTGAGTWALPRIVGQQNAMHLVLSAAPIDAAYAKDIGFVLEVVEPDELQQRARELAAEIALGSPFAVSRAKRLLQAGASQTRSKHLSQQVDVLTECQLSDDHREGVRAFIDKRPPHFTGR